MDVKLLANMFYWLAIAHQNGDATATAVSLIHVQRNVEKLLPVEEAKEFRTNCGLLYW